MGVYSPAITPKYSRQILTLKIYSKKSIYLKKQTPLKNTPLKKTHSLKKHTPKKNRVAKIKSRKKQGLIELIRH